MKNLILLSLVLMSGVTFGTTYYIAPSGNDSTPGNGTSGNPYRSLSKAASVCTSGDIINVAAGNYASTLICNLPVNVSIVGAGKTLSKFFWTNTSDLDVNAMIVLSSTTINTSGSQSISGISIDGVNSTGKMGIYVKYRGNVSIHDCNFVNLDYCPARFKGLDGTEVYGEVTTYVTGNSFNNCTVTNCDRQNITGIPSGIMAGGQDGFTIYNCTILGLSNVLSGDLINIAWSKNIKIHDNTVKRGTYVGTGTWWWFSMEIRWNYGGFEIYNNTIMGTVDLCYNYAGSSGYSVKVYNNLIGQDAIDNLYTASMDFEADTYDAYVFDNTFKNCAFGVITSVTTVGYNHIRGLHIYRNLMYNISQSSGPGGSGVFVAGGNSPTFRDIFIDNNTIIANTSGAFAYQKGIYLPNSGTTHNLRVRNNIIVGFTWAAIYANLHTSSPGCVLDSLYVQNNNMYSCGHSNLPFYEGITLTNDFSGTHYSLVPGFANTTDYSLLSNSQMRDLGMDVGRYYQGFPDIGYSEFIVPDNPGYNPGGVWMGKQVSYNKRTKH